MLERNFFIQQVLDAVEPCFPADIEIGVCYNNLVAIAGTGKYRNKIGTVRPNNIYNEVIYNKTVIVVERTGCDTRCISCDRKHQCEYKTFIASPILTPNNDEVTGIIALLSREKRGDTYRYISILENLAKIMKNIIFCNIYDSQTFLPTILDIINDNIIAVNNKGYILNLSAKARKLIKARASEQPLRIAEIFPNVQLTRQDNDLNEARVTVYPVSDIGYVLQIREVNERKPGNVFTKIIGTSKAISVIKEQAVKIAGINSTVLICGETGTGKELMVKAIHEASHRKDKPFVIVNCGAIPESLMESELFGYVGGAFTGANKEGKAGKFELAHEGTLFLDEIGEMPLSLQAKLLRVLEDHRIDRLGGREPIDIDVRVVVATNRDLGEMVKQGKFRQDLYYRLNIFVLELPPLRERKEDIFKLVEYYLNYFNLKFQKNVTLSPLVMEDFLQYSWPGNIRELRNVLEGCVAMAKEDILTRESLPTWLQKQFKKQRGESSNKNSAEISEKEIIRESLSLYGRSTEGKRKVAELLNISRATLYRKMKKYGIC